MTTNLITRPLTPAMRADVERQPVMTQREADDIAWRVSKMKAEEQSTPVLPYVWVEDE